MAKLLKLRRGTTTQHGSFTGAEGEVTIDTTKDTAVVHDGSTAGGRPLARQDMNNVPAGTILGTQLENSGVTAGQYGSSSAIPIVTVDAQGLVTAASTTSIDSTKIQNGSSEVSVANNGSITSNANHDFSAGIDVTGNITNTGTITSGGNIEVSNTYPSLVLTDTNHNSDYRITNNDGQLIIFDSTNGAHRLNINADGHVDILGNLDVGAGLDVTGDITVTGSVDGVDVAALNTTVATLSSVNGSLANGVTATTQAQSDDTTKVATTAYVRTAISEAQAFPSGTKMLFQQTAAPTGWTKVTSGVDNKALRVVSGSVSSGGSNAFSNTFASRGITANAANTTAAGNVSVANTTQTGNVSVANTTQTGNVSVSIANANTGGTVNSHTLTVAEMPSHNHSVNPSNGAWANYQGTGSIARSNTHASSSLGVTLGNTGGGGGHSHGFTGGSHGHNANASFSGSAHNHNASFSGDAHNHNASFTGSAHNHSISVTNLDLAVQYLDVIIASKD
jgi:hypothetical protein